MWKKHFFNLGSDYRSVGGFKPHSQKSSLTQIILRGLHKSFLNCLQTRQHSPMMWSIGNICDFKSGQLHLYLLSRLLDFEPLKEEETEVPNSGSLLVKWRRFWCVCVYVCFFVFAASLGLFFTNEWRNTFVILINSETFLRPLLYTELILIKSKVKDELCAQWNW